jgi:hypothetical protein
MSKKCIQHFEILMMKRFFCWLLLIARWSGVLPCFVGDPLLVGDYTILWSCTLEISVYSRFSSHFITSNLGQEDQLPTGLFEIDRRFRVVDLLSCQIGFHKRRSSAFVWGRGCFELLLVSNVETVNLNEGYFPASGFLLIPIYSWL